MMLDPALDDTAQPSLVQTPDTQPLVRVEGLRKTFGSRTALDGINLEIQPGESFALLGPNGSGKSTLLRILSTLLHPSSGTVQVAGLDLRTDAAAVRHRLGVAFQSPSLDVKLTVRENLRFQGHLYGLSGAVLNARIDEVLSGFELTDRSRERVETLSGGLRRRVELAKTLLHRPQLLLLDEPSTGLDPAARREFWQVLGQLREQTGLTLIAATHLLDEADGCDRVALLHMGKKVADGPPETLKDELGGSVLTLATRDPESLAAAIHTRLDLPARVERGEVRVEGPALQGPGVAAAVPRLLAEFPAEILSLRVGKATLEDVFFARTGVRIDAP